MTTTERLADELARHAEEDGSWSITADELALRYDAVDLYRATYEAQLVSVDYYDAQNVGELLLLLDALTGRDYRPLFRDLGLFLTHDDRIDLAERFVRLVRHAVVLHTPEPETFRAMVHDLRRYDRAELAYLSHFFRMDELIDRCVCEYLDVRSAPALRATVTEYLELLVRRHIVDLHLLAPALIEILRTVGRHEGALPDAEHEGEARREHVEAECDDARPEALRLLGLHSNATHEEIRASYRRLMRRYHPDINPDGLEMAKRLTNAYGVLVAG